jgi:hypothetical protein
VANLIALARLPVEDVEQPSGRKTDQKPAAPLANHLTSGKKKMERVMGIEPT